MELRDCNSVLFVAPRNTALRPKSSYNSFVLAPPPLFSFFMDMMAYLKIDMREQEHEQEQEQEQTRVSV